MHCVPAIWMRSTWLDLEYSASSSCPLVPASAFHWENCLTRTARADNYLCSKNWDFQSTYTHEMLHILGLGHAQDVTGGNALGRCDAPMVTRHGGNPAVRVSDPAMTCAQTDPPYLFTTARRTYAHGNAYDTDALLLQMRNRIS